MRSREFLVLVLGTLCSCRTPARDRAHAPDAGVSPPPHFQVNWSPTTGKGDVIERLLTGDLVRTCFHCNYDGYTGGLVIGNMNGSGMGFYPVKPLRGFRSINLFCAQDESIWDLDEQVEYTYGWSENFGTGSDGKRLEYQAGRVLEHDQDHLVLASENAGGCYRVFKIAAIRAETRYWTIATRIQNRCDHPVHFSFFTGDDPWIGLYASSDGDVGYTERGLVRRETLFALGEFTAGGLYDLGNRALGQAETGFSNQANFFAVDPTVPLPDFAGFANRFAHDEGDIHADKPLSNQNMIALNLGWRRRTLGPGEFMETALALGMAETGQPGSTPKPPAIGDADWSTWRRYLQPARGSDEVLFAAERVEMDLVEEYATVTATYHLHNPSAAPQTVGIQYPILVSPTFQAPKTVEVDGEVLPVGDEREGQVAVDFPIKLPTHGLRSFRIRYQQRLLGHEARYLVTSALRWSKPIDRAVFVIRHPSAWRKVQVSYPVRSRSSADGRTTLTLVEQPFRPNREVVVRWAPAKP